MTLGDAVDDRKASDILGKGPEPGQQVTAGSAAPEPLTKREIEILNLIFSGHAASEVAKMLSVSKRTVDFHLGKAYVKMGVTNRGQAFRKATELGILSTW